MRTELTQQVLELVLSAGPGGIKARVLVDKLRSSTGLVRHALLKLEATGQIERTRKRGKNLFWGTPGVAERHKALLRTHQADYERLRAKEKREQRAMAILDSDVDLLPVRRVVVPAVSAPPLRKPCACCVWELAA